MARWKELPGELDVRTRQLVVQLRRLKDLNALSLASLAAKTGYSKSSWERYLNGRSLPPREAVEALAEVGGIDPTRLLALYEVAAATWPGREAEGSKDAGEAGRIGENDESAMGAIGANDENGADPRRPVPRWARLPHWTALPPQAWAALAVSGAVMVTVAVLLVVRPWADNLAPSAGSSTTSSSYTCHLRRSGGHWYAGISSTWNAVVGTGNAGPEVAEAQCLLHRIEDSPGAIDGDFGPLTQRAVQRAQYSARLPTDGIVGPQTWKALRG